MVSFSRSHDWLVTAGEKMMKETSGLQLLRETYVIHRLKVTESMNAKYKLTFNCRIAELVLVDMMKNCLLVSG